MAEICIDGRTFAVPEELWLSICCHCPAPTRRSLQQAYHFFHRLLTRVDNQMDMCRWAKCTLPSKALLRFAEKRKWFFDFDEILDLDPFGSNLFTSPLTIKHTDRLTALPIKDPSTGEENNCLQSTYTRGETHRESDGWMRFDIDLYKLGVPAWLLDAFEPRIVIRLHGTRLDSSSKFHAFGKMSHGLDKLWYAFDACGVEEGTEVEVAERGVTGRQFVHEFDCNSYHDSMRFIDFNVHFMGWLILRKVDVWVEMPSDEEVAKKEEKEGEVEDEDEEDGEEEESVGLR